MPGKDFYERLRANPDDPLVKSFENARIKGNRFLVETVLKNTKGELVPIKGVVHSRERLGDGIIELPLCCSEADHFDPRINALRIASDNVERLGTSESDTILKQNGKIFNGCEDDIDYSSWGSPANYSLIISRNAYRDHGIWEDNWRKVNDSDRTEGDLQLRPAISAAGLTERIKRVTRLSFKPIPVAPILKGK